MQYEFIESSLFAKMVYDYLSEDDYTAFQQFLLEQPERVTSSQAQAVYAKCVGRVPVLENLEECGCASTRAMRQVKFCCW